MKEIWQKLRLRKADEMEQFILFKAQRNAYYFLLFSLLIWSLYESYQVFAYHGRLNLLPCLLLVAAVNIQSFSQLILTRNAVKDDEDSYETGPLAKIVLLVCVVVSLIATVVAALVLVSVKI